MVFHDLTIVAGAIRSRRQHETATLSPAAVEVFRDLLERHGERFRVPLPVDGLAHLQLQWTEQTPGAALATFWAGTTPLTTSALLSGADPYADAEAAKALQQLSLQVFRAGGIEAGFELGEVSQRPAILTAVFPCGVSDPQNLAVAADAETCLAAAYFLEVFNRGQ